MKHLFTCFFIILNSYVFACTCGIRGEASVKEYIDYDVIFRGRVVTIKENNSLRLGYNNKEMVFEISESFKGDASKRIIIYTSFQDASCGLSVDVVGCEWIIFANRGIADNNLFYTSMCTPSKMIKNDILTSILLKNMQKYKDADGFNIFFNPEGKISAQGIMTEHKPDGYWLFVDNQFGISEDGYFKNSLKDSTWTKYDYKNRPFLQENYVNGKRHGKHLRFNTDNGKIISMQTFLNGSMTGPMFTYHPNGNIKMKGFYKDYMGVGIWTVYDEEGNVICSKEHYISYDHKKKKYSCEE